MFMILGNFFFDRIQDVLCVLEGFQVLEFKDGEVFEGVEVEEGLGIEIEIGLLVFILNFYLEIQIDIVDKEIE